MPCTTFRIAVYVSLTTPPRPRRPGQPYPGLFGYARRRRTKPYPKRVLDASGHPCSPVRFPGHFGRRGWMAVEGWGVQFVPPDRPCVSMRFSRTGRAMVRGRGPPSPCTKSYPNCVGDAAGQRWMITTCICMTIQDRDGRSPLYLRVATRQTGTVRRVRDRGRAPRLKSDPRATAQSPPPSSSPSARDRCLRKGSRSVSVR
jgi:hypothetical protein